MRDKIGYLAEETSKQNVREMAWFFLTIYSKTPEEKDKLKESLSKKEPELEDLEKLQPVYIVKNEEARFKETLSVWLNNSLIRKLV